MRAGSAAESRRHSLVALTSLARSAARLSPAQGLLWGVVVLTVPVIGSIAWFAVGRRAVHHPRGAGE
jgi:hypothetical protein